MDPMGFLADLFVPGVSILEKIRPSASGLIKLSARAWPMTAKNVVGEASYIRAGDARQD